MLFIHRLVFLLYVVEDMNHLAIELDNVGRVIFACLNFRESVLLGFFVMFLTRKF